MSGKDTAERVVRLETVGARFQPAFLTLTLTLILTLIYRL
jgi:hypothetical protein